MPTIFDLEKETDKITKPIMGLQRKPTKTGRTIFDLEPEVKPTIEPIPQQGFPFLERLAGPTIEPGLEWTPPFALPGEEIKPAPPISLTDRIKGIISQPFTRTPEQEKARSQNIYAISKNLDLPLSTVRENYDQFTKATRDYPTTPELLGGMMIFPIAAGLAAHPLATVIGVGGYIGLSEIESGIISRVKKEPYKFFQQKGLKELLPEETNQYTKDTVDILDFIGKGLILGGIYKKAPRLAKKFTKNIVTDYKMPKKVYISPEKVSSIFRTGKDISPQELDLIQSLGLSGDQYKTAMKKGVSIEIPAEKIVTIVDKPYFGRIKRLLKLEPYKEVKVFRAKKPIEIVPEGRAIPAPIVGKKTIFDIVIKPAPKPEIKPEIKLPAKLDIDKAVSSFADKMIERFGKEQVGRFENLMRAQLGKKKWIETSREEKLAETKDYARKDIAQAKIDVKGKDLIEYMVDRTLDPLDPMNVFYGELLKSMGAEVTPGKSVKLPKGIKIGAEPTKLSIPKEFELLAEEARKFDTPERWVKMGAKLTYLTEYDRKNIIDKFGSYKSFWEVAQAKVKPEITPPVEEVKPEVEVAIAKADVNKILEETPAGEEEAWLVDYEKWEKETAPLNERVKDLKGQIDKLPPRDKGKRALKEEIENLKAEISSSYAELEGKYTDKNIAEQEVLRNYLEENYTFPEDTDSDEILTNIMVDFSQARNTQGYNMPLRDFIKYELKEAGAKLKAKIPTKPKIPIKPKEVRALGWKDKIVDKMREMEIKDFSEGELERVFGETVGKGNLIKRTKELIKINQLKIDEVVEDKPALPKPEKFTKASISPKAKPIKVESAVKIAQRVADKKSALEILSNVLVKGGNLIATDLETTLVVKIDKPDGLYKFVGNNLEKSELGVKEFPVIPYPEIATGEISSREEFMTNLQRALRSVASDETRYILTGALLRIEKGKGSIVATDGRRLSMSDIELKNFKDGEYIIANPKKVFNALKGISGKGLIVKTDKGKEVMSFQGDNGLVISKLLEGNYPDYRAVLKTSKIDQQYIVNKDIVSGALKTLKPYALEDDKTSPVVTMTREGENLILTGGKKALSIPVEVRKVSYLPEKGLLLMRMRDGDTPKVNFNFLVDAINNVKGDKVFIGLNEKEVEKPVHIYGEGPSGKAPLDIPKRKGYTIKEGESNYYEISPTERKDLHREKKPRVPQLIQSSPFKFKYKRKGYLKFPQEKVSSPADVAFAFQELKNEAVEKAYILGLKKDNPISIELISMGTINMGVMNPFEGLHLLLSKKADSFYLIHNHPSGSVNPSNDDKRISSQFTNAYRKHKILFKGHVIVNEVTYGLVNPDGTVKINALLPEIQPTKKVPQYSKYIKWTQLPEGLNQVTSPEDVIEIIKGLNADTEKNAFVMYLNTRNGINSIEMIPNKNIEAKKIAETAVELRAPAVILANSKLDSVQLKMLDLQLAAYPIMLTDSIDLTGEGGFTSAKGMGLIKERETPYIIRDEGIPAKMNVGELIDELEHALLMGEYGKRRALRKAFYTGKKTGKIEASVKYKDFLKKAKERKRLAIEAKVTIKNIKRLLKIKGIHYDYQPYLDAIKEKFEFIPRAKKILYGREETRKFIEREQEAGHPLDMPEKVLSLLDKTNVKGVNIEVLKGLKEEIQHIVHIGRFKNKLLKIRRQKDLDSLAGNIAKEITKGKPVMPPEIKIGVEDEELWLKKFHRSLMREERQIEKIGGMGTNTQTFQSIWVPIDNAENQNIIARNKKLDEIANFIKQNKLDIFKMAKSKEKINDRVSLTSNEKLWVYLSSFNEKNLKHLIRGNGFSLEDIEAVKKSMTPLEKKIATWAFKMMDQYKEINAIYRRIKGKNMNREEMYAPIIIDWNMSGVDYEPSIVEDILSKYNYKKITLKKGFTKERIGGAQPLVLDFWDNFIRHIKAVERYKTHALVERDVGRLISHPEVKGSILQAYPKDGMRLYKDLEQWFGDAIGTPAHMRRDPLSKCIQFTRRNSALALLGLNVLTMIRQTISYSNAVALVSSKWMIRGTMEFLAHPISIQAKVFAKAPQHKYRFVERDIAEQIERVGRRELMTKGQKIFSTCMQGIRFADRRTVVASWWSAYKKELFRTRGDESKAVKYANYVIRRTQPMHRRIDLSALYRSREELTKAFTMFSNMPNQTYNFLVHDMWRAFKEGKVSKGRLGWMFLFTVVVPSLLYSFSRRGRLPKPKEVITDTVLYPLVTIPGARDASFIIANKLEGKSTYGSGLNLPPLLFLNAATRAITAKKPSTMLRYGVQAGAYLFGVPYAQPRRTLQGIYDLATGETDDLRRLFWSKWAIEKREGKIPKMPRIKRLGR